MIMTEVEVRVHGACGRVFHVVSVCVQALAPKHLPSIMQVQGPTQGRFSSTVQQLVSSKLLSAAISKPACLLLSVLVPTCS